MSTTHLPHAEINANHLTDDQTVEHALAVLTQLCQTLPHEAAQFIDERLAEARIEIRMPAVVAHHTPEPSERPSTCPYAHMRTRDGRADFSREATLRMSSAAFLRLLRSDWF